MSEILDTCNVTNVEQLIRTDNKMLQTLRVLRRPVISLRHCSSQSHNAAQPKQYEPGTTHFGFETVAEADKEAKVHKVFEEVSKNYDVMNDAMSMGIHRIWKDMFMEDLSPTPGTKLLDMAGGTGDIAFRYLKYLKNSRTTNSEVRSGLTISDINQHMLDVGKGRSEKWVAGLSSYNHH